MRVPQIPQKLQSPQITKLQRAIELIRFDLSSGECLLQWMKRWKECNLQCCSLFLCVFFNSYPAGEFVTFYFKLPRFHQLLERCLHYHFEEGHLVSQKRGNRCFASDLLNSLGSSLTAAAYSHRKARKLVRGGSGDQAFRWDWTGMKKKGRDKLPHPACIQHMWNACDLKHLKTKFCEGST